MTAWNRAGILRRLAALLIDMVLVVFFAMVLARPILKVEGWVGLVRFASIDTNAGGWMAIILVLFGATWGYLLIEAITAATPGKWILGLAVRQADGLPSGILRRLARYFLKVSCLLIVVPFGIGENMVLAIVFLSVGMASIAGLFQVFGKERQTLYDSLSRTAVCRRHAVA
jgi:uncharacterized RDD family membrane protein YckC